MVFFNIEKDQSQNVAIFVCALAAWLFKQIFLPSLVKKKVKKIYLRWDLAQLVKFQPTVNFYCKYKPLKVGVSNGNADITLTIPMLL